MKRVLMLSLCLCMLATSGIAVAAQKAPAQKAVAEAPKAAQAPAPASQQKLPTVVVLATGGTIASAAASSTQLTEYKPGLTAEQLLSAVPSLKDFAVVEAEQIANVPSPFMPIEVWLKLAKRANEVLARADVDGIVVTHGTDTMEETAYFLNLVIKSDKPVVLVGAMRPATAISADGPLNLLQAVNVAGSADSRGKGVMVVLNGEINGAREVTKTSTTQPETFRSNDLGFLGYVVQNKPVFYRLSNRKHTSQTEFDISSLDSLPKVEIVYNYLDMGLDAANGIIAAKPDGIISAGSGNGSVFNKLEEVLAKAVETGIVVVRSSRTGTGIVTPNEGYGKKGFIAGDNLNPQKARVLLMLALTKSKDPNEIKRMFATY